LKPGAGNLTSAQTKRFVMPLRSPARSLLTKMAKGLACGLEKMNQGRINKMDDLADESDQAIFDRVKQQIIKDGYRV